MTFNNASLFYLHTHTQEENKGTGEEKGLNFNEYMPPARDAPNSSSSSSQQSSRASTGILTSRRGDNSLANLATTAANPTWK